MAEKEKATAGKAVASTGLSANGNNAHPHSTMFFSPGSQAVWRNADHDQPVVIVGMLGEQGGVRYYSIEGSTTGIPEHELSVAGPEAAGIMGQLESLLEQARVEPADVLSAKKVQPLIDLAATYQGYARQALLDGLRPVIGHLPSEERQALNLFPLFEPPKQKEQVDGYLASCPAPPGAPVFKPMSFSDLLAMPPKVYLIDQMIGAGDIGALYGQPGSGKTFVIVDMIMSACLGRQFAMRFDVPKRLQVAYCAGEGASGLPGRFAAAGQYYGVTELPGFTFFPTAPQLFDADALEGVARFIAEWRERQAAGNTKPLDLLVIDTLHSATVGADENSAQDMGKVLSLAKLATRELGCAVLLVHHSNKAGTGERGSSALRGAMDIMIEVKEVASKYAMSCEKLKDGEKWKDQTFDLTAVDGTDSVRVWWDEPGDLPNTSGRLGSKLTTEMQSRPGVKFTAKQLAEAVGCTQVAAINALARLVEKGDAKRQLLDESKPPSNRNSWVFFIDPVA